MKGIKSLLLPLALVVASVSSALAVTPTMSPADVTSTTAGISDALVLFFTFGGACMVAYVAIWGFGKAKGLFGGAK